MLSALTRLLEGILENLARQALTLDVHLQGGDAMLGAGNLEIHVAAMIFGPEDVRQNRDIIAVHDKTHGNASDGLPDRHTRIHHRQRRTADGGHRR